MNLYISNGTIEGTLLFDFPGSRGRPSYFATYKEAVYFRADYGGGISTIYKSDGTKEGTVEAIDGTQFGNGFDFGGYHLMVYRDALYFLAYRSATGGEIWRSEGTTETTTLIEVEPGREGSEPWQLTATDNYLFFLGKTAATGRELMILEEEGMSTPIERIQKENKHWFFTLPNPVNESLSINFETANSDDFSVRIWTITGQLLQTIRNRKIIDVSNLLKGIYLLEMEQAGIVSKQKFVKE